MRRSLNRAIASAPALFVALSSFVFTIPASAQDHNASSQQATRAMVKAELDELVAAGYNPRDWQHYPDNLWAAQSVVAQRHAALAQDGQTTKDSAMPAAAMQESVGGAAEEKSEAGAAMHSGMPCAGNPQCSVYFGH